MILMLALFYKNIKAKENIFDAIKSLYSKLNKDKKELVENN